MKVREFETVIRKLRLETRNASDRLAWFRYDGISYVFTKRSYGKRGGEVPHSDMIRQQLRLNEKQMRDCIGCTFGYEDYVRHLKDTGVIP